MQGIKTKQDLLKQVDELKIKLAEAEETLDAIRSGAVDAIVATGPEGDQVFTLKGADHSYRELVETMNEGAVTIAPDQTIMYCNGKFAQIINSTCSKITGKTIDKFIYRDDRPVFYNIITKGVVENKSVEIRLVASDGKIVPVLLSFNPFSIEHPDTWLIFTDLTELKLAQCQLKEMNDHLEELVVERTEELKESQKIYKELVTNARSIIIKLDNEGRFTFLNEYGEDFFGFTKNELLVKKKV